MGFCSSPYVRAGGIEGWGFYLSIVGKYKKKMKKCPFLFFAFFLVIREEKITMWLANLCNQHKAMTLQKTNNFLQLLEISVHYWLFLYICKVELLLAFSFFLVLINLISLCNSEVINFFPSIKIFLTIWCSKNFQFIMKSHL